MSGVAKSVKKVFKKAVKVAKKVAPVAIAAAAIYFTAGAALGASSMPGMGAGQVFEGGWSASVSRWLGGVGGDGLLNNVLTKAVTQAGMGAAVGGGMAAVTGNDISKGALMGAGVGAVTGGVTGAMTHGASVASTGMMPNKPAIPLAHPGQVGAGTTVAPTETSKLADWAAGEQGATVLGGALEGGMKGIGAMMAGEADAEAQVKAAELAMQRDENNRSMINANYGGGQGLLNGTNNADAAPSPYPASSAKYTQTMWRFDPEQGRIVKLA